MLGSGLCSLGSGEPWGLDIARRRSGTETRTGRKRLDESDRQVEAVVRRGPQHSVRIGKQGPEGTLGIGLVEEDPVKVAGLIENGNRGNSASRIHDLGSQSAGGTDCLQPGNAVL